MKLSKIILIALAFFLVQCQSGDSSKQKAEGHAHNSESKRKEHEKGGHGHEEGAHFSKVHLTQEKLASLKLAYDTLRRMTLKSNVKANGRMTLSPDDRTKISALIGGRVKKVNVIEGDYVEKGEVLALLEGTEVTHLQKQYLKNKEKLPYLKQEYERQKRLLEEEVGSERSFQKARSEYQSTRAEVNSLEQNLRMLHIYDEVQKGKVVPAVPVIAPFSGHIGKVNISRGEFVDPEQFLIEVMNTGQVHIDLDVYEKDIEKVRKGQTVLFTYANQPGPSVQGKIFKVGRKYHRENQSIKVHVKINEPGKVRLIPGVYVNAKIQAKAGRDYVLPEEAVIRDGNKTYVFAPASEVQTGKNGNGKKNGGHKGHEHGGDGNAKQFVRIPVKASTTEAGYTAIQFKKTVAKNIRFVTKGAYYLQAEMKKTVGGHHH
ncbi:MAG: efflux RND transporter periplasmic adaptor subunit [Flavobacteriales bacterium]